MHITQYLFTIIDSKEFKKRFYWPIVDKRSENAYRYNLKFLGAIFVNVLKNCRLSSVDFINMLIEKHGLPYEQVKQVNVVHPSGKKFMALILEIIQIATKEVMHKKYRCTNFDQSLDINESLKAAKTITQVESDLHKMLNEDVKVIKERSHEIQEIFSNIIGHEELIDYERFITSWLAFLKQQSKSIEQRNIKIKDIIAKAHQLLEKAQEMMSKKEFVLTTIPSESFNTSVSFLIENMKKILPIIKSFIVGYPVNEVNVTAEEKQIVKQKLKDLEQMDMIVKGMTEKCKSLQTTCTKLNTMIEARQFLDNDDTLNADNDNWKLSIFTESSMNFEAAKNCTTSFDLKGFTQLALLDENDNTARAACNFNRTLEINAAEKTFKVPSKQPILPSRRRRRDPMEILDKATSSGNARNQSFMHDNSIMAFKGPTSTPLPPFSSTMLSPDMHRNNMMLNFSTVSEISMLKPHVESAIDRTLKDVNQNSYEKNPMEDITNSIPKISIIEATLPGDNDEEETLVQKENFGSELSTLIHRRSIADEDLFNISDSCLIKD